MMRTPTKLFDALTKIECDLQSLKFEAFRQFGRFPLKKNGKMNDDAIVRAVRSVRKKLWNEKYSRAT